MNWSQEVDLQTREKIQSLMNNFDKFIDENHNTSQKEDFTILQEWKKFKAFIMEHPNDIKKLEQYVQKLQISKQNSSIENQQVQSQKINEQTKKVDQTVNIEKLHILKVQMKKELSKTNNQLLQIGQLQIQDEQLKKEQTKNEQTINVAETVKVEQIIKFKEQIEIVANQLLETVHNNNQLLQNP